MATNITVRDLDNYPDVSKTITVDQSTLVPTGAQGDEKWVLSFVTSAYSDIDNLTAIQDIYVQEFSTGWIKSSGLVDLGTNIVISALSKSFEISIDGSSYYDVVLTEDTYGPDSLADHMQSVIRGIPTASGSGWSASDDQLAFKNSMVEYNEGKFKIISGNVSEFYTGSNKSSVHVRASGVDTLYAGLGFDLGTNSEDIATRSVKESLVVGSCGPSSTAISINTMSGLAAGDPIAIVDDSNTEYFIAASGTSTVSIVVASGTLVNSYTANEAKVQRLRVQDPDQKPVNYHSTVDSIMRWGILSVINQIDFSS
jgi:hypothetical protein